MTVLRESVVLPALFLTVALLGGLRVAAGVRLLPPSVMALALAMLLFGCLVRARVLVPESFMHSRRTALENVSGLVVLLTLFAACAQVFNLVTPETGLLHALFSVFFLVQLLTTMAAVRDRVLLLRGLGVLLGSAFLLRFVVLESLYATDGGTLQRVLTVLLEGVTLGTLGYSPNSPVTGYAAFLALALFIAGLALLGRETGSLVPGSLGPGALGQPSLDRGPLSHGSLCRGSAGHGSPGPASLGPGSSGPASPGPASGEWSRPDEPET
jgi:hypothetical protein